MTAAAIRASGGLGRPGRLARTLGALRTAGAPAHIPADPAADLAEARSLADQWRDWAEACERRIAELETSLSASEMTALDLRSRLVCLQGKLATSTATARYQTLSLALEGHPPAPAARDAEAVSAPGLV